MSKLTWLTQEIDGLKEQGLYNNIRTMARRRARASSWTEKMF
jgi:hypothetical protein